MCLNTGTRYEWRMRLFEGEAQKVLPVGKNNMGPYKHGLNIKSVCKETCRVRAPPDLPSPPLPPPSTFPLPVCVCSVGLEQRKRGPLSPSLALQQSSTTFLSTTHWSQSWSCLLSRALPPPSRQAMLLTAACLTYFLQRDNLFPPLTKNSNWSFKLVTDDIKCIECINIVLEENKSNPLEKVQ